jgi:hypothetical protein
MTHDPLQGEPFVWARFEGDTLSGFFFINVVGEYEIGSTRWRARGVG